MTRPTLYRTLFILIGLTAAGSAYAAMYKWTDDEGNTHYSQVPPAGRATREIAPPPKVSPPAPVTEAAAEEPPGAEAEAEKEKNGSAPPAMDEKLRKQNCETARKNLTLFKQARRVMINGELTILTDESRRKHVEESQKQVEQFCK